mmetsp:Transcript_8543/g.17741  ORF Transcript_8543/g.17741 Transcript_8543/m.17741 type:complete len:118 (-) Transcript_8543:901-1254(-)
MVADRWLLLSSKKPTSSVPEVASFAWQNPVAAGSFSGVVVGMICCGLDGGVGDWHIDETRCVDCSAAAEDKNVGPDSDIAAEDKLHDGAVGRRGDGRLLLVAAEASCEAERMEPERE